MDQKCVGNTRHEHEQDNAESFSLKAFIYILNQSIIISTNKRKKNLKNFYEEKKVLRRNQPPYSEPHPKTEDPKHKLIELPAARPILWIRQGKQHDQLPTREQREGSRSLTLWMVGLQHIIALASGGFIRRIKPGVSYRKDPLRKR
jgi:hypothetical protein